VTPNPGFKVTVYVQVEYLKNGASYGQSYYRTLIGKYLVENRLLVWQPKGWIKTIILSNGTTFNDLE